MQGQKNLTELLVNVEATLHEMFAVMQDSTKKKGASQTNPASQDTKKTKKLNPVFQKEECDNEDYGKISKIEHRKSVEKSQSRVANNNKLM